MKQLSILYVVFLTLALGTCVSSSKHPSSDHFGGFLTRVDRYPEKVDAETVKQLDNLANIGSAEAQVILGRLYFYGDGVPQDYGAAFHWFKNASNLQNADAHLYLGAMFYNGIGIDQNLSVANEWFKIAADRGNSKAQLHLGITQLIGEGGPKDERSGLEWITKSAEQGLLLAQLYLTNFYTHTPPPQQNYVLALTWYKIAGLLGDEDRKNLLRTKPLINIEEKMTKKQIQTADHKAKLWVKEFKNKMLLGGSNKRSGPKVDTLVPSH